MPAAMRSASICVLPEPAPASTRMLVSSCSRIVRRECSSVIRESGMVREPPERVALGVRQLDLRLGIRSVSAGSNEIAVPAVVLVLGSDEVAAGNYLTQVGQNGTDRRERGGLDSNAFAPPFVAGEVVNPAAHLRFLVAGLQQFESGEPVERVLQATPAGE